MNIYWKLPRQNKKRKAPSDRHSPDDAIVSSAAKSAKASLDEGPVYVWFNLMKYNLEQQEASQRLSQCLVMYTPQSVKYTAYIHHDYTVNISHSYLTILNAVQFHHATKRDIFLYTPRTQLKTL